MVPFAAVRAALEHSRVAFVREMEMRKLRDCYASLRLRQRERQVMFALTAVMVFALGVAASTAIFAPNRLA